MMEHFASFTAGIITGVETGVTGPDGRRVRFVGAGVVGKTGWRTVRPYVYDKTLLTTGIG